MAKKLVGNNSSIGNNLYVVLVKVPIIEGTEMNNYYLVICPENGTKKTAIDNAYKHYFKAINSIKDEKGNQKNSIHIERVKEIVNCDITYQTKIDKDFNIIQSELGEKMLGENPSVKQCRVFCSVLKRCQSWQKSFLKQELKRKEMK